MRSDYYSAREFSRRDLLKVTGAAVTATALAKSLRAGERAVPPRPFEINANLYAWDLHDEGVERILDNLQEMAAINSVYLVGVMHPERRPLKEGNFPHNSRRQIWYAEDARCYWHPDLARYGRVKPRLSDHDWLNGTDWLGVLVNAARRRGLRVGVELSHALIDVECMQTAFADLAQRNFHGQVTEVGQIKWLRPPCPNHPDTLELAAGLAADVVASHGVDYVSSCVMCFDSASIEQAPMIAGCFCAHCQRAAHDEGLALEHVRRALVADPTAPPALGDWVAFRDRTVARFHGRLGTAMHAINPGAELRYNLYSRFSYRTYGVNPALLRPQLDSMRITDYAEQDGDLAVLGEKQERMRRIQKMVGEGFPLHAAVSMRLQATPETVRQGIKNVVGLGLSGITASHYDGAQFPVIRAVRPPALAEAGIAVPAWKGAAGDRDGRAGG